MSMDDIIGSSRTHESQECDIHEHMRPAEYDMEQNSSVSSFENDFIAHGLVLDQDYHNHEDNRPCIIRWKSGKRVDPRLLTLLESFREVYLKRKEFFKRIFPGMYDEFVEVFKKFSAMMLKNEEMRSLTMERSLSFGTMRAVGRTEEGCELVLEKFKVKAPTVIVAGSAGQGGQTGKADPGSSNSK